MSSIEVESDKDSLLFNEAEGGELGCLNEEIQEPRRLPPRRGGISVGVGVSEGREKLGKTGRGEETPASTYGLCLLVVVVECCRAELLFKLKKYDNFFRFVFEEYLWRN